MMKGIAVTLTAVVLFASAGCGGNGRALDIPEIPPIKIGSPQIVSSSGNKSADPEEEYDRAYSDMRKQHVIVLRDLNSNTIAVREGMARIIDNLHTMQSLTAEPQSSEIGQYVKAYEEINDAFMSRRFSNMTKDKFERCEQDVHSKFAPQNVQVVKQPPAADNRPDVPAPTQRGDAPPQPSVNNDTPLWVYFKAWEKANEDFLKTYKANEDARKGYQRVRDALDMLKKRLPNNDQSKLQIYINEYQRIYTATAGFTRPPDGGSRDDVLRELTIVSEVVSQAYKDK